jgi:hypothetical protein
MSLAERGEWAFLASGFADQPWFMAISLKLSSGLSNQAPPG